MDKADIDHRFTFHAPTPDRVIKHQRVRSAGREMVELFNELIPDSREKSLAVTRIEEAVMWANAGLARTPEGDG